MQIQTYKLEGLAQANEVITSSNSESMAQLSQVTVTMNAMQAQMKTLTATSTNPTRTRSKFYSWICGSNFTHRSKTYSDKKNGHKEEAYHKKLLG